MSRKILIADDEPNMLLSLEFLMKRAGFREVGVGHAIHLPHSVPNRDEGELSLQSLAQIGARRLDT